MLKNKLIKELETNSRLTNGNLQIIACAGSGKTEFVSTRVAYLVAENLAKPENILAFTFTEKAAEELKFRIRSKIRELIGHQPDIGDMYVGTIHSFCFELLKEYVPGFRGYDVLEEGKRYAFMSSIRKELNFSYLLNWLEKHRGRKPYGMTKQSWITNTLIRGIDIVREEMIPPTEISACRGFFEALQAYDKKLHEKRLLDFSSMMSLAVDKLENNRAIRAEVKRKFTHITVDEYQDINPIQEKLIKLIAGNSSNLCVVGDDDQSIYQWRGSTIENIITFKKRYKNVFPYPLSTNYRSTDGIINLSNNLIIQNNRRLKKSMKPSRAKIDAGDIYKVEFQDRKDEIEFIVDKIKELIGTAWVERNGSIRGLAYSDFAIFFRSVRYDAKSYLEALDKDKIPYAVSGVGGLFETSEVDVIFSIFAYLGDFEKIWITASSFGLPDENTIYHSAKDHFLLPTKNQFVRALKEMKASVKKKTRISLQSLYADILIMLGLSHEAFHNVEHETQMYNLGRLSQAISDYEGIRTYCTPKDIKRFCWFIIHYAQGSYDAGAGEDPTRVINAVQVMTLHATKGLGFPVVFMPYCIERSPQVTTAGFLDPDKFDFERYAGSTEDERRLFYVGLTRSKKFLFVTTSIDPGPHKRKKTPSEFFNELEDKYCITKPISDPTKRRKKKPQPSVEDYRFPTNYSELSDYIRCEYDYKMRYIYGFNPIIVQALGYGKQIHNILNLLHKNAQKTGGVPSEEEAAEILKEYFYLRYAAREQEKTLKRSALRSTLRYLEMWREDFTLSVKSERSFEMDLDNALVNGTIDLLKRKNTKENILEIIDFKTGNERKADEELTLQVQLYTIAARDALKLNVEKAYVHFLDEEKQQRVEILTTPKQLDLAMQTISDAIKGITTRRFNRNPRNVKICNGCDWNKICPKKKK